MNDYLRWPILGIVLVSAAAAAGEERIVPSDYGRVNSALVENHVLPRYMLLSAATERFSTDAQAFCREAASYDLIGLRNAFHDAMQAWMGISHVGFGPVEYLSRAHRFHFWPQARGKFDAAVSKALTLDKAMLDPEQFAKSSVAVQGFPAAEILLYDKRYLAADRKGCRLLLAIAGNLERMARRMHADWVGGNPPFSRAVTAPGSATGYFEDHQEVTLALFRSLHDGLQFVLDVRLKPVMGDAPGKERPYLAESRPSGRSLRNVVANLSALQALYGGEGGAGLGFLAATADPKLDRLMRKAFRITISTARSINRPLEDAVADSSLRPKVQKLILQVRALRQIARDSLAETLGLAVGFNALDGD